jgi:hypothetical protein
MERDVVLMSLDAAFAVSPNMSKSDAVEVRADVMTEVIGDYSVDV